MNASNNLLTNILNCGYLDLDYLTQLVEDYKIDFDTQDIIFNYWITEIKYLNINIFIHEAYEKIKDKFFENSQEKIEGIYNRKYTIYTNYMDSHLWFESEELQTLFESWKL